MRKLVASIILLAAGIVGSAWAAEPETVNLQPGLQLAQAPAAPAAPQLAAPPPMDTGISWTGCYIGVNGGSEWTDITNAQIGKVGGGPLSGNFGSDSATRPIGGGQVGCDYQWGSLVFGVRGQWDFAHLTASGALPSFPTFNLTHTLGNLPMVTGRVGYALPYNLLLYAHGGVAWQHDDAAVVGSVPSFFLSETASFDQVGPVFGGGLEWMLAQNWSAFAEYNYIDFGNRNVSYVQAGGTAGLPDIVATKQNPQTVLVGLNYHFGLPPALPPAPMAMPAPPPMAPKVFIVFFDWDKDVITPEGQQIIQQAADAYKAGAPVQLQVTGYTDRSGSPGYNQRLSERRANNVAKALAALGVPKNEMVVSGRGENDNRVPTAPGVREPQNRRVEIVS